MLEITTPAHVSCNIHDKNPFIAPDSDLDMSACGLTRIPECFKDNKNIISMDLSYNQITKIENLPPSLQYLDLSNNNISEIDKESLEYLTNKHHGTLKSLFLTDNQISDMPLFIQEFFKRLDPGYDYAALKNEEAEMLDSDNDEDIS